MIWEDPRVDLAALQIRPDSRIVTIASGGCNALSYLTADPERIHAVDLNCAHVALNKLKITALRQLADHRRFYALFGSASERLNVALFDDVLAAHLDPETRSYWNGRDGLSRRRIDGFAEGFYRQGLLGRFIAAAHAVATLYGKDPRRMMRARTRDEQIALFETELAPLFDRRLVRLVLGHRAALYGLGIPPAQYAALLGDASHMADVVRERLRKLACDFDIEDNYFAWAAFNRGFAKDGTGPVPPYLEARHFRDLKSRVDRVSIELVSFTEFLARQPAASLDRYVLLDAQDWMSDQDLEPALDGDHPHRPARRARDLPHGRRGNDPARARAGDDPRPVAVCRSTVARAWPAGSLGHLRRLSSLRAERWRMIFPSTPCSVGSTRTIACSGTSTT